MFALLGDGNMLALAALSSATARGSSTCGTRTRPSRRRTAGRALGPGRRRLGHVRAGADAGRDRADRGGAQPHAARPLRRRRAGRHGVEPAADRPGPRDRRDGARFIGVGTTSLLGAEHRRGVHRGRRATACRSWSASRTTCRSSRSTPRRRAQRRLACRGGPSRRRRPRCRRPPSCSARAERPMMLAGRGAVESGAREAILALAERTGALLGTTLLARDWFRGEPFDIGLVGGLSSRTTRELIAEADVVLAVGAGLGYFATDNGALLRGKNVIQVDLDPPGISEGVRAGDELRARRRGAGRRRDRRRARRSHGDRLPHGRDRRAARGPAAPSTPTSRPSPAPSTPPPHAGTRHRAAGRRAARLRRRPLLVVRGDAPPPPRPGRPPPRLRLRRRRPRPPDRDRRRVRREPAGRAGRGRRQPAHARRRALDRREGEPEPARGRDERRRLRLRDPQAELQGRRRRARALRPRRLRRDRARLRSRRSHARPTRPRSPASSPGLARR